MSKLHTLVTLTQHNKETLAYVVKAFLRVGVPDKEVVLILCAYTHHLCGEHNPLQEAMVQLTVTTLTETTL